MATRTVIELIDDLDGSEATETVRFALDGNNYEIDLGDRNADELRGELKRFVGAARKTSAAKAPVVRRLAAAVDTKAVRAWAQAHGVAVNPRGRVRENVVQQYLAARG